MPICIIFVSNGYTMKKYTITDKPEDILNEPLAVYSKSTNFFDDAGDLGFDKKFIKDLSFDDLMQNKPLLMQLIRRGISPAFFKAIVKNSPFEMHQWSEFLDIPMRTLQRYFKQNKLLKPIHTEKIIEFVELIRQGLDTFGSMEKFKGWLCAPSLIFSNKRPCELLTNSIGMRMVSEELLRIEHGIFV